MTTSNSYTEENYLKTIFKLHESGEGNVTTNAIADAMNTKAASVTDMLKRLATKGLLDYKPYQGVSLSAAGRTVAVQIVRKHRLWECFLTDKLNFKWDEVHDIAEELEHINSTELINRLDAFLGYPQFDPHGDPIPTDKGIFGTHDFRKLSDLSPGESGKLAGVSDHSNAFLQYLEKQKIALGSTFKVLECHEYDRSLSVDLGDDRTLFLSSAVSSNLLIKTNEH